MGLDFPAVATLLLLVLAITCSGNTTHYVKPTPDITCPAEPCLTLSEYAQQPHEYLTSNTTLLLLPGVHVLRMSAVLRFLHGCSHPQIMIKKVELCAEDWWV